MVMVCDDTGLMCESSDYVLPSSYRNAALALDADANVKREQLSILFDISDGNDDVSPMIDNDTDANIKHIGEMSAALREYFEDVGVEFTDNITSVAAKLGTVGEMINNIIPTYFVHADYNEDVALRSNGGLTNIGYGTS